MSQRSVTGRSWIGVLEERLEQPERLNRPFGYFPNVNLAATMALRGSTNAVG